MKEKRLDYRRVAFIGGGNMTAAIAGGLLEDGYKPGHIAIAEPLDARRDRLQRALPGVFVSADNDEVTARSGSIVLAVKPQIIAAVCLALADTVQQHNPLIVSIAAGPRIDDIDGWLGGGNSVVRVMPNQPALIRRGVSGLFANAATTSAQRNAATAILSAVGPVVAVDSEADIDAVTAVSGSGPAYVYLLIEMLATAGVQLGLSAAGRGTPCARNRARRGGARSYLERIDGRADRTCPFARWHDRGSAGQP